MRRRARDRPSCCRPRRCACSYPDAACVGAAADRARRRGRAAPGRPARTARRRSSTPRERPRAEARGAALRRGVRHPPALLSLPDLVERRRDPPPRRHAGRAQGALPPVGASSSRTRSCPTSSPPSSSSPPPPTWQAGSRCCRTTAPASSCCAWRCSTRARPTPRPSRPSARCCRARHPPTSPRRRPWPAPGRRASRSGSTSPRSGRDPKEPERPHDENLRRAAVGRAPYVMVAVLVSGTIWRYRYDKFGWTTRSSELHESRLLRIGARCSTSGCWW